MSFLQRKMTIFCILFIAYAFPTKSGSDWFFQESLLWYVVPCIVWSLLLPSAELMPFSGCWFFQWITWFCLWHPHFTRVLLHVFSLKIVFNCMIFDAVVLKLFFENCCACSSFSSKISCVLSDQSHFIRLRDSCIDTLIHWVMYPQNLHYNCRSRFSL